MHIHLYTHKRTPGIQGIVLASLKVSLIVILSEESLFGTVPLPPVLNASVTGSRRRHPAGSQGTTTDL